MNVRTVYLPDERRDFLTVMVAPSYGCGPVVRDTVVMNMFQSALNWAHDHGMQATPLSQVFESTTTQWRAIGVYELRPGQPAFPIMVPPADNEEKS